MGDNDGAAGGDAFASGDDAPSGSDNDGASSDDAPSGSSSGADGSTGEGGALPDGGVAGYDPSVYQHHKNGTRNGLYIDSVLTSGPTGHAATMHILPSVMGTVSMQVYAQPLYLENGPDG